MGKAAEEEDDDGGVLVEGEAQLLWPQDGGQQLALGNGRGTGLGRGGCRVVANDKRRQTRWVVWG